MVRGRRSGFQDIKAYVDSSCAARLREATRSSTFFPDDFQQRTAVLRRNRSTLLKTHSPPQQFAPLLAQTSLTIETRRPLHSSASRKYATRRNCPRTSMLDSRG